MENKNDIVRDPLSYARDVVGKDPFATHMGIEVDEVREGYARCSLTVRPEYLNAVERVHGGVVYALADQALAVASNSTGVSALSLSFTINYVASAMEGEKIFSEALPVNQGKKISLWRIEVRGTEDRLIATGEAVAYHR